MSARSVSLGEMFRWVPDTFGLVRRNFGAMSVASLINLVAILLMMAPMFFLMFRSFSDRLGGVPLDPANPFGVAMGTVVGLYAVMVAVGLLLLPPLMGGWFRLCEDCERGAHPAGTDVLRPYSELPQWLRLVGCMALSMLLYFLVMFLIGLVFSGSLAAIVAAQNSAMLGGQPSGAQSLQMLGRILLMEAVAIPLLLLAQFVGMVAMAEVSLRPTPVLLAFKEAFVAVARNAIKLLVWLFCMGLVAMIAMFIVVLVVVLLVTAVSMLSQGAGVALMALLYVPLLLVIYPLMFGGFYLVWRSMLGGAPPPPAAGSIVAA